MQRGTGKVKPFAENDFPTVGIEQEFHLTNPETGEMVPCVDEVIANLDENMQKCVGHEMYLSVIEHQSPVCREVDRLVEQIVTARHIIAQACEKAGVRLAAAGSHPFSDWRTLDIVPSDHYEWVVRECVYPARRMLAFGLHVHVGMQNEHSAMHVMHEMRRWLYPLLALSANSPYFEGRQTGLLSTRMHLFGSMPRATAPPEFEGFPEIDDLFQKLLATGDVTAPGDLWWLIRPQPPFGTVEIRSLDLPTDVGRVGAISAIIQAAMALYQDKFNQGRAGSNFNPAYMDQNRWKAMRYGLEGKIIEPQTGEILTMREQLQRLLEMIAPKAEELGSTNHIEFAKEMLRTGTEAEWQIQTCRELGGDLRALELEIAKRTLA